MRRSAIGDQQAAASSRRSTFALSHARRCKVYGGGRRAEGGRVVGEGERAYRAACRDDMVGETGWVAFLVVELGLDRMRCARAGSSRALVLPWEARGQTEHAVAVRLGAWDRGCRRAGCRSGTSESQLMPRLLGRSCGREASSRDAGTLSPGGGLAGRELFLLVIAADQILIGLDTRHADAGAASRSTQVPVEYRIPRQIPSTRLRPAALCRPPSERGTSFRYGTLGALGTAEMSTPPHACRFSNTS